MLRIENQKGIVLVTALLIMVILTLLATAGIKTSITDVKIGANFKNSQEAFYAADGSVEVGKNWLTNNHDLSYHPTNTDFDHDSDAGTPAIPVAVDPTNAADLGYGTETGKTSYAFQVVSLDPSPSLPVTYTARSRVQEIEGFSAKQTSAYGASTKIYNYYYQIDASGSGSQRASREIEALFSYRSEN